MQFTGILSFVLATATLSMTSAAPIQTCSTQGDCIKFTMNKVNVQRCTEQACEYEVCMHLNMGEGCTKSSTDTVSHTCEKQDDACTDVPGFSAADEIVGIGKGYESCHIVPPGGTAEFLLKDGRTKDGCGESSLTFQGHVAQCETLGVQSCTGKGNVGLECVWRVQAPTTCGNSAGGGGDPHIKKWDGRRFFYHGECDLLLLQSKEFADNTGLDLQIRTTIKDFYSFIEMAALRIGDSVLEFGTDGFWIDGIQQSAENLPMNFAGYTLNEPMHVGSAHIYRLDLNQGDSIIFRVYKFFLSIDVIGEKDDFGNSIGLLGDYETGEMIARDGETIISDADKFGAEWQVRDEETMLFREAREPQLPHATCNMPSADARRLAKSVSAVSSEAAHEACSEKSVDDFEFCVADVLATGDLGMAGAW